MQYPHTILLPHNPNIFQRVVLRHIANVIFNKVVDVLTEKVHATRHQDSFVVLHIYYKLEKEHEQQVEGLELTPTDFGTYLLSKFEKSIGNADTAVDCAGRADTRV